MSTQSVTTPRSFQVNQLGVVSPILNTGDRTDPRSKTQLERQNLHQMAEMQSQTISLDPFKKPKCPSTSPNRMISSSTRTSREILSGFHAFPTLLPEIRHLIWTFALSQPRLVPICFLSPLSSQRGSSKPRLGFTSSVPVPSVLHVCQEAREIGLKHFSLSFRVSGSISLPSKIFFNPQNDILYFPSWKRSPNSSGVDMFINRASFQDFSNTVLLVDRQELLKVKTLALHESLFMGHPENRSDLALQISHLESFWWYIFDRFQNVVELTIAGCEAVMLEEFPKLDPHVTNYTVSKPDVPLEPVVQDEDLRMGDDEDAYLTGSDDAAEDRPDESLYDLMLGTYWDLRSREPGWVPPRWRVWRVDQSQGQSLRAVEVSL